jgi:Do/DeqQ family serine protease
MMTRIAALFLAGLLAAAAPAAGQGTARQVPIPPSASGSPGYSFAPLVRAAAPAVVNVYSRRVERTAESSPLLNDPLFRRFFGDQLPFGMPRERVAQSLGSGVLVEPDGVIVTNNHVIEGATEIVVVLADRREFEARLVAADARSDLAILRIDAKGEDLPYLHFHDSDQLEVGDIVLAIGNPFGVGQTVTSGIVSALGRTGVGELETQSFIQTDAAINPGNSGGALITLSGRLAGINTAIYSRSGGSLGIGFAIPSNLVATTVASAVAGQGIVRPWLGVSAQAVTADIAASLGMAKPGGALVTGVYDGGPADKAGVRIGDVILKVDGREVLDGRGLRFRAAVRRVGDNASLELSRAGKTIGLTAKLAAPPESPPRQKMRLGGAQPLAGATVANLSPAFAEEIGFDPMTRGVVVAGVDAGSTAARVGIRPGDVITAVNEIPVTAVDQLQNLVRTTPRGRWIIGLRRAGQSFTIAVRT